RIRRETAAFNAITRRHHSREGLLHQIVDGMSVTDSSSDDPADQRDQIYDRIVVGRERTRGAIRDLERIRHPHPLFRTLGHPATNARIVSRRVPGGAPCHWAARDGTATNSACPAA